MADFFLHSSHPDRYSGVDLPLFSIFHRRPDNKGFTLADDDFCPSSNNTSAVRKTQIACSRGGLFNGHILSYHYNYSQISINIRPNEALVFSLFVVICISPVILLSAAPAKAISRRLIFLAIGLLLLIALNELSKLGLDLTAPKLIVFQTPAPKRYRY